MLLSFDENIYFEKLCISKSFANAFVLFTFNLKRLVLRSERRPKWTQLAIPYLTKIAGKFIIRDFQSQAALTKTHCWVHKNFPIVYVIYFELYSNVLYLINEYKLYRESMWLPLNLMDLLPSQTSKSTIKFCK